MKIKLKITALVLCICLMMQTGAGFVSAETPTQKQDGILPTGTPELSYDVTEGEPEGRLRAAKS